MSRAIATLLHTAVLGGLLWQDVTPAKGQAAVCALILALACLAVAAQRPSSQLGAGPIGRLLLGEASLLLTVCAPTLLWHVVGSGAVCVWSLLELRSSGSRRVRRAWALGVVLPALLVAAALYAPPEWADLLLVGAAVVRFGLPPFQAWFMVTAAEAPVSVSVPLLAAQLGPLTWVRAYDGGLSAPEGTRQAIFFLGLFAAVVASFVSLVRDDGRRVIAMTWLSQAAIAAVGYANYSPSDWLGAALQSATSALALSGLLLITDSVEARIGRRVDASLGGLGRNGEWLSRFALIFAVAAISIPGSPGFLAEDLLVDGLIVAHPLPAIMLMAATVFSAIAMFRFVLLAFFGSERQARLPKDALRREWLAFAALGAGLLALTARPSSVQPVVEMPTPEALSGVR